MVDEVDEVVLFAGLDEIWIDVGDWQKFGEMRDGMTEVESKSRNHLNQEPGSRKKDLDW